MEFDARNEAPHLVLVDFGLAEIVEVASQGLLDGWLYWLMFVDVGWLMWSDVG